MRSPRYGVKLRKKVDAIVKLQKTRFECPKCGKKNLRRKGNALWDCASCGALMAGGAFQPFTGSSGKPLKTE